MSSDHFSQEIAPGQPGIRAPARGLGRGAGPWVLGAALIAALVLAPILSVLVLASGADPEIWPRLWAGPLPRYLGNTAFIAAGVGLGTAVMGTIPAWLVAVHDFPGRRVLEWALLMPLAIPAYVGAYALVDFLEYAGPVQSGLRAAFGWARPGDYWFPEIRSRGFAALVLAAALYPYVYLLARAALREQPGGAFEVARALGAGPGRVFLRVGLPLVRPAVAAGAAIAMMESVADFGVVDYFGVQTLTTGIFSTWLEMGDAAGAAQIATLILVAVALLAGAEKAGRARARHYHSARHPRPLVRQRLRGPAAAVAAGLCALPVALGFVLPVGVIGAQALAHPEAWFGPGLARALWHTVATGGLAATAAMAGAIFMVYGMRIGGFAALRGLGLLTTLGYAAPGAVLAVGILIPLARLDHGLADLIEGLSGHDPGLLLTGSAFAIVLAFVVRFFAIAQGAVDGAFGRISPSLPMAARALGQGPGGVLRRVHMPLMAGSVGSGLLLVFVDCVKELPATLLLRPFNYETLATRMHEKASLEKLGEAAPAALLVMAVGLAAAALLARMNLRERG
ncbi:ABC transporter permease [Phaeovulum vinaykumarii]|nr:iron ABC transporter permease [Phaeovulum vinaykumarii]